MIIMSNHVYGIIHILPNGGVGPRAYPIVPSCKRKIDCKPIENGHPRGDAPPMEPLSLSDVVHRFKSLTTARYRHGVYEKRWLPFNRRLWQRNYHDEIITNERDLTRLRKYIASNPEIWGSKSRNPA